MKNKEVLNFISPNVSLTIFPVIKRPNFVLYNNKTTPFDEKLDIIYRHGIDVVIIDNDTKLFLRPLTLGDQLLVYHTKILKYFIQNEILKEYYN